MWYHRYGFRGPGGGPFRFFAGVPGFWFGNFPPIEEELKWLEEYRTHLKGELDEVERRIERLKGGKSQ
jgi:hypothetical protein